MENKGLIIDSIIQLYKFGKKLPVFSVVFDIIADTDLVEKYIVEHVDMTDYEGRPLSPEIIEQDKVYRLASFHKSKNYNISEGKSKMVMTRLFTTNNIKFEDIKNIINGDCQDLPKGYQFSGKFKLRKMYK